jgi:hypothetical protein
MNLTNISQIPHNLTISQTKNNCEKFVRRQKTEKQPVVLKSHNLTNF